MHTVNKISNWDIRVDIQTDKPCELYVDTFPSGPKECLRVLWSVEPNEISGLRDIVIGRHEEFDLILTWHKEVLDNCPNARLFPHGMSWILDFDLTSEKEYCVTSIVGGKRLVNRVMQDGDRKNELFYSQYHIAIENVCQPNYFSEKLVDCFQTNTIPIYLGCPNIEDFFDVKGMFIVNTLEDIVNVCNSITPETYNEMSPYVKENYERSIKYAKFRETLRDEVIEFVKNS
jgi:hypothetical protein